MFGRALIAFIALPGVVAFVVPLLVFVPPASVGDIRPLGAAVVSIGAGILGWCVRDFYVLGHGTLAPWDPPRALVVRGLYRYSRNPMYVGVLCITLGWALGFESAGLAIYTICLLLLFHLRVVLAEEPFLARTHGDSWTLYAKQVPRWIALPRVRF